MTPITTSHYAAIADSFYDVEFEVAGERDWLIRNRGALQTVRFEKADDLAVDPVASRGVLGQNRHAGALYVALDESVEVPRVVLASRADLAASMPRGHPVLVESRWRVRRLTMASACQYAFEAEGYGDGEFVWDNLSAGAHRVSARRGPERLLSVEAKADADGRLDFVLPVDGLAPVSVTVECSSPELGETSG